MTRLPAVLVTRPAGTERSLVGTLAARGFRPIVVPTVATEPVPAGSPLDAAAAGLAAYDWVAVTSAAAVDALLDARRHADLAGPLPVDPPRWVAVGPATAGSLRAAGVGDVIVAGGRGASVPAAIAAVEPLAGLRVLLPRADAADPGLPAALRAAGAVVDEVVAYRTVEGPAASRGPLAAALADPDLAAVVVASGSAARGLDVLARHVGLADRLVDRAFVAIGPSTAAVVDALGWRVAAEAASPTPESLADAVAAALSAVAEPAVPEPIR